MADNDLHDFEHATFTHEGKSRTIFRQGSGPAVIVDSGLGMAVDDRLVAPVLSQPGLPLGFTARQKGSIDVSSDDLDRIKQRCAAGLSVMGLRFRGDRRSPAERFDFLRAQLGDAFIAIELDDAAANPDGVLSAHSVLTEHLIDEPGEPTQAALHRVLDFLAERLEVPGRIDR
ncbi:hypothetical protein [Nocardia africana]|uniref:Uncharacterized protein n=1 Tax=Nocardia africana TaxID=134964 RepID=A0A378WIX8_9NOCA|nr:hypothetical protein [Nocardia africana]MCC3316485.1 hypothetical protein [Nocardia africana]SUA41159.1 Uncharacterised protein [Nocardia africana]